jgi:hypothetical protein
VRTRAGIYRLDLNTAREMCARDCCEICGDSLELTAQRHIDHCHGTGKVRGILCGPCNRVLANARDRSDVLVSAAQYLIASGTDKSLKEKRRA